MTSLGLLPRRSPDPDLYEIRWWPRAPLSMRCGSGSLIRRWLVTELGYVWHEGLAYRLDRQGG